MAEDTGKESKSSTRLSDEQRKRIEEKVRGARGKKHSSESVSTQRSMPTREAAEQIDTPESSAKAKESISDNSAASNFEPIDKQQREALRKQVEARLKSKNKFLELRKRLLSMAGKEAAIDDLYPYNDLLLDRGQTWNSLEVNLISGPEMVTERSVARLWRLSPALYSIAVGYALDAAGTWHKHSWLIALHKVQEVKLKYAVYYGVLLSAKESEVFAISALGKP
ncbi:MAG: hypothetical protein KKA36_05120 [Gammaproteobacteria bacterium]|nr:hypothetical protein [Gammaproteobacteria bacterium]MBU2478451.1 hypothetical protein [Gammaproteobacteria bacterium]